MHTDPDRIPPSSALALGSGSNCGYRLGRLRGMKEAHTSSTLRLSVLASGPQSALERLVSTYDPSN